MAKQTKLEDNFFISPDEFINEFKEVEKIFCRKDLQFINSVLLLHGKKLKTKEVFYKLSIIENEVYGVKIIVRISKSKERTEFKSKSIKFLPSEADKYFNYPSIVPSVFSLEEEENITSFKITKEDFIQEFFKYAIEHKVGLVFKTGERVIDFSIKGTPSIRFKLDYTKEEAVGTKYLIYEKQESLPIVFTKEESMMYFNFLENPSQELTTIPKYKLSGASTQDNFKYEEHYPEYKIDFIEELIDLSKKKNTVVFFDEEKLLFTLEHKESKTTTIKLIIEYTSEEAVGQRYVNEEADYRAVFSKSESQSHLFFMNVGLNLANKLIK